MRSTELPGYQVALKEPDERHPILSRAARYSEWLGQRMAKKAELEELIYQNNEQPIDLEELKRAPLFEFGRGFTGHPPTEYKPGTEPAFAPMSREQMRLLLIRVIPPAMLPFVLEHFTFDFDIAPYGLEPPPGPMVQVKRDKVMVTFYRSNFITTGVPNKDEIKKMMLDKSLIHGYVDPSKIAIFLGKVIGEMIEPPAEWPTIVEKKFAVTQELKSRKRRGLRKPKKLIEKERLDRQWRDFVALAVTSPDHARQRYPEAYQYFTDQVEQFADISTDKKAISTLKKNRGDGPFQLAEFKLRIDVRTEEEKLSDKGLSPQLAWYDRFAAFLNRGLALFGRQIILNVPEDPERAAALAEDDRIVKSLLESADEKIRDLEFGEIVASARPDDVKARNQARRYLLAASQAGELAEWRIYAWLNKFSQLFRETKGKQISETDYKDLQLVYSQSDKVGNRIGTGVLPFKAVPISVENDPKAKYYPRRLFLYVKDGDYAKEVEKKVRAKNPRAIFDALPGVIKQFEKGVGFDEGFDSSPAGMATLSSGSLETIFGPKAGKEIAAVLAQHGIGKISPDAKAVATAYFEYYRKMGRKYEKDINPAHFATLQRYSQYLNTPPEQRTAELEKLPANLVAESDDVAYILERSNDAAQISKEISHTIGLAARDHSGLTPDIQDRMSKLIEQDGLTDPNAIQDALRPIIHQLFGNKVQATREERNLFRFLNMPNVRKSLDLYERAQRYHERVQPNYAKEIAATAEYLTDDRVKPGNILPESLQEEDLAEYEKAGIKLNAGDQQAINEAGSSVDLSGTTATNPLDADKEKAAREAAGALDATFTAAAKDKVRAEIVAKKIKLADDKTRRQLTVGLVSKALDKFNDYIGRKKAGDTYHRHFQDWLKGAGRVFSAPTLASARLELESAVRLMDRPATTRAGLDRKSRAITQLSQALNYQNALLTYKEQPAKINKANGDDEE